MAREYARIGTGIWSEPTITSLNPLEQRAYLLVLTQPELNRCGVVPYTLRRWAGLSTGDNASKLRLALRGLEQGRHIVVDEDTEELLARTYVRHDGLLTQPQVVGAMVRDFRTIRSVHIRRAFLNELRRIWHLPLDPSERRGLRIALGVTENDKQREIIGEGLAQPMLEAIEQGCMQPFTGPFPAGLPEALAKALARPYPYHYPSGPSPCPGPECRASHEHSHGEADLGSEVDVPREAKAQ